METQPCDNQPAKASQINLQSDDDLKLPPQEHISASAPALRFPRPQGSQHLANWVSNSLPELRKLPSMSDTNSLADSAYEIIHGPDSENQDDRLTESTCSLPASRPDDVHSLDGSVDHLTNMDSDEDEEEETANSPHASSIRYADQTLQSPSTQLPSSPDKAGLGSAEWSDVGAVPRPIELEVARVIDDGIMAQYVMEEYSPEKSAQVARDLDLPDASDRLGVVLRQTLAHQYLSTREPLRVLYVGRSEAQWTIVHKISSAIWASSASQNDGSGVQEDLRAKHDKVYNIVPISSFGSHPELDLMEASPCQIKVECCTSADEFVPKDSPFEDDVAYYITTEQGKQYRSSNGLDGPVIQPPWDLPHLAVFYGCQQDDDLDKRITRIAKAFMKRHEVPSIFIIDQPNLVEYSHFSGDIDIHAPHLSLESLDPEKPMTPWPFPIDLASFSNIDDRHLNHNLAFLTGLVEEDDRRDHGAMEKPGLKVQQANPALLLRAALVLIPAAMMMAAPFFMLAWIGWRQAGPLIHRFYPSSSTDVCSPPPVYPAGFSTIKTSSVVTSTRTVVVNFTSTKTVQVSQAKTTTSALASALSLAGLLSDGTSTVVPTPAESKKPVNEDSKKTVCSVQVYGRRELLVAIPSRNKAVWLANGAIDIEVRRSDETIKTKISSVDEGVIVELRPKDAYGKLNVSVVTTRRPKINETFQVDMGRTAVADAIDAGLRVLHDALKNVPIPSREDARKLRHEVASAFHQASEAVRSQTNNTVRRTKDNLRDHLARRIKDVETVGKQVDLSVLQAQIASRLWWLKVQGKMEEYAAYERNATRLLRVRYAELARSRETGKKSTAKEPKSLGGFASRLSNSWKRKNSVKQGEETTTDAAAPGGPWRKLMGGM
ncbi:hypothetical protein VTJ49DRAFT_67 [Mycothermus thermophilus]|uniref:Uncharacterized protein n=1 Tax=Humicola insolens TaxID=85995 RepID=A0ABR3VRU9_HUMIN